MRPDSRCVTAVPILTIPHVPWGKTLTRAAGSAASIACHGTWFAQSRCHHGRAAIQAAQSQSQSQSQSRQGLCMKSFSWLAGIALAVAAVFTSGNAAAQSLPVSVDVSGNVASARIGLGAQPLAEVTLAFQDVTNLNASSIGISAERVNIADPALLARLPDAQLLRLDGAFPLLITIEPPLAGGLSFRGTGRVEIHTHALPYAPGSSLRLYKAPLGGAFRDVTDEIAQGSVRARGTYGGFSQFLVLADVRPTATVIAHKIAYLRGRVDGLATAEQPAFDALLDTAENAIAQARYTDALTAVDAFRARAHARAGAPLANVWRAARDLDNQSGELEAGAATLRFSVAYLRDFGQ